MPKPPSLTHSSSLWFGDGASRAPLQTLSADVLTLSAAGVGAWAGVLFLRLVSGASTRSFELDALFDYLIPGLALGALFITVLLTVRQIARVVVAQHQDSRLPRFGRKGLIGTGCSVMFAFSCVYRALNIADEGAAMCRGSPTPFNAPVSGRFIATLGEVALVVQLNIFINERR